FFIDIIAFVVGLSQMSIPFLRANGTLMLIQEPLFRLTPASIEGSLLDREAFVPVRYGLVVHAEIGRSHLVTLRIKRSFDGSVAPLDCHKLAVSVLVFRTDFAPTLKLADSSVIALFAECCLAVLVEKG